MQLFDGWHLLSDDVSLASSLFYLKLMVSVELGVGYNNVAARGPCAQHRWGRMVRACLKNQNLKQNNSEEEC